MFFSRKDLVNSSHLWVYLLAQVRRRRLFLYFSHNPVSNIWVFVQLELLRAVCFNRSRLTDHAETERLSDRSVWHRQPPCPTQKRAQSQQTAALHFSHSVHFSSPADVPELNVACSSARHAINQSNVLRPIPMHLSSPLH